MTVHEKAKIEAWQELACTFVESGEYNKGLNYFQDLLLEEDVSGVLIESYIYNFMGYISLKKKDYDIAIKYRKKVLSLRKKLQIDYYICEALNDIAIVFYSMGKYEEAKDYYMQSLDFLGRGELKEDIGVLYCNIAALFYKTSEWDRSISFFSKALDIFEKLSCIEKLSETTYNMGIVFYLLDNYKEALSLFHRSFIYYKNLKHKTMPSLCEKKIADIYFEQNNLDKAKSYYYSCMKNVEKEDVSIYYDVQSKLKQIKERTS